MRQKHISFNPITWVINGLSPSDLRPDKPISRYAQYQKVDSKSSGVIPDDWKRPVDPTLQFYSRYNDNNVYVRKFCPASRCSEWSTLREMLPGTRNSSRLRTMTSSEIKPTDESKIQNKDEKETGNSVVISLLNTRCGGRHALEYSPMTR